MKKSIYYSIIYGMGTFVNILIIPTITDFWVRVIYTCLSMAYFTYGLFTIDNLVIKEENKLNKSTK